MHYLINLSSIFIVSILSLFSEGLEITIDSSFKVFNLSLVSLSIIGKLAESYGSEK